MSKALFKISARSLWFNRKDALYQIIITAILAAIICGSLLTGHSVRKSLATALSEKLGNSDLLISTGSRYFDASVAWRLSEKTGVNAVAVLENDGYCRNFSTGAVALNTKIYGITDDFFRFHKTELAELENGKIYINERLSKILGANEDDEVIITFSEVDPIPSNAPFAPSGGNEQSRVFKIASVLSGSQTGNFSLGTSQVIPGNIFVRLDDLDAVSREKPNVNRLLVRNEINQDISFLKNSLKEILNPSDIGLSIRISAKTGESEIISNRIFIDGEIADEIINRIPEATPVLTYLANSFSLAGKTTPYSFISALPESISGLLSVDEIKINSWLADDLEAKPGDSLLLTWYDPGMGNLLEEKSKMFIIQGIAGKDFRYSDPSLMPDFPGISGSATCSGWDAGVPILLESIRGKDEEYWNIHRGTPKAFINYGKGKELWGNNFGSATSIRFPEGVDPSLIVKRLTGAIDPLKAGFTFTDLRDKNSKAAMQGVDFGTLFLSLSFFILVSCLVLLTMAVSLFFDARKRQVRTYFALGFKEKSISIIIFWEAFFIALTGAITGMILSHIVNMLLIKALNSVWTGAVQTNTLTAELSIVPLIAGFIAAVLISVIFVFIKLKRYLANISVSADRKYKNQSYSHNAIMLFVLFSISAVLFGLSFILPDAAIVLSFTGGTILFAALIVTLRLYYAPRSSGAITKMYNYSRLFYSFNPSQAVTPAIFLAAGIFAVIITSANRQVVSERMLLPSGGTGGYLLWAESAIPVRYNLNSPEGRKEFGFNEEDLKSMTFVQAKRLSGDDASCLNISHVTTPPVLGIDPGEFIKKGAFSFVTTFKETRDKNPWELLNEKPVANVIYGIADQTVLQWGLKIKTGDTLKYLAESGDLVKIVICAGLQSSVFQGYLLIGAENFKKCFPSVGGSSIFLVDGKRELSDLYTKTISERLSGSGIYAEPAIDKLASFFEVTNTYLEVFTILGGLGIILGAAGLGFILKRNFNTRKHEFALMVASGFTTGRIKKMLFRDQLIILLWGLLTGIVSALYSTRPSISHGADLPWIFLIITFLLIIFIGVIALSASVSQVNKSGLVSYLRKD